MPVPLIAAAAGRRLLPKIIAAVVILVLVVAAAAAAFVVIVLGGSQTASATNPCLPDLDPESVVDDVPWSPPQLDEFDADQLKNAQIIVNVGRQLGVPEYGQVIAVATAIQESTLTNVTHGDDAGPDSRGLFQQRDPWGPEADRIDPIKASKMFYTGGQTMPSIPGDGEESGLLDIDGWQSMSIGEAAQSVQGSADPLGVWYQQHEHTARKIVAEMGGSENIAVQCGNGQAMVCPKTPWPDIEQGLTPDALRVIRCVHEQFPQIKTYGGVGERSTNSDSDHPSGRAVDAMIPKYQSKDGNRFGWEVAEWVKTHAPELGVKYVIFDAKIWEVNAGGKGWETYDHPSGATDDTSLHRDHVHVSVYGNAAGQAENNGSFTAPITAPYTITATWGETSEYWETYHTGTDLACPAGTPIHAVAGGKVISTAYSSAYGNLTQIRLPDATEIWYAHQTTQRVSVGDVVGPGEVIGTVGATGNVTGPHLHLEVRIDGSDIDPVPYLEERGVTL